MNYYQFHIGDYISHTSHLSADEDLAYRRMLDLYYMTEKPLGDAGSTARRIKSTPEIVQAILSEFFTQCDDGWRNKRCDAEIDAYQSKISQAKAAGRASAEARKVNKINGPDTDVQRSFNAGATDVQPTNNHKPITNNQKKERISRSTSSAEFDLFWNEYPRKVGRGLAVKAWSKAIAKSSSDDIRSALVRWKASRNFPAEEKYIPHASTWLNAERWLDNLQTESVAVVGQPTDQEREHYLQESKKWLSEFRKNQSLTS